jgi:hypothetical protein
MKTLRSLLALAALAFLAGCASVPMSPGSTDAEAKTFGRVPGKASVYVNRDGWIGTAVAVQIVLDGRIAGALPGRTYMLLTVEPGPHTLSASVTGFGQHTEQAKMDAEVGKLYFYRVTVGAHLTALDQAEGRKRLMRSKRAEATY